MEGFQGNKAWQECHTSCLHQNNGLQCLINLIYTGQLYIRQPSGASGASPATCLFRCMQCPSISVNGGAGIAAHTTEDKLLLALAIYRQQSTQMVITLLAASNAQLRPQFLDGWTKVTLIPSVPHLKWKPAVAPFLYSIPCPCHQFCHTTLGYSTLACTH